MNQARSTLDSRIISIRTRWSKRSPMAACGARFWLNFAVLLAALPLLAQDDVSFATSDGWTIHGDLYGTGDRGLVLAHGGRFEKGSWAKQAPVFAAKGFRVL